MKLYTLQSMPSSRASVFTQASCNLPQHLLQARNSMAAVDVETHRVQVRLYDVSRGLASRLSGPILGRQIDGLYHATTVVNGVEYSYGPSLTRSFPGQNPMLRGTPTRIIDVGATSLGPAIVDELMRALETRYNADTYDVVFNNCTTFSNELVQALTGQQLPDDVLNQLQDIISTPLGDGLLRVLAGEAPPAEFMATHGDLLHDIMRNLFSGGRAFGGFGHDTQGAPAAGDTDGTGAGDQAAGGGANEGGRGGGAGGPFPFFGGAFPFFGGAGGPWMRRGGGCWGGGYGGCGGGTGFRGRGGCWMGRGGGCRAGQGAEAEEAKAKDAGASGSGPKQVPVTTPDIAPTQDDPKGKRAAAAPTADDAMATAPAEPASDSDAAVALIGGLAVDTAAGDAAVEAGAVEGFVVVPSSAPVTPDGVEGMQE